MKKGYESVEVYAASTRNRMGDATPGALIGTLEGCHVVPRMLGEDSDRGSTVIEGFEIVAPGATLDIPSTAEVVVRGDRQQIDGQVGDFRKRGRTAALIFMTKRYGT